MWQLLKSEASMSDDEVKRKLPHFSLTDVFNVGTV